MRFVSEEMFMRLGLASFVAFYESVPQLHSQNNRIHAEISEADAAVDGLESRLSALMSPVRYCTHSEMQSFMEDCGADISGFMACYAAYSGYFTNPDAAELYDSLKDVDRLRHDHNRLYIERQLAEHRTYFDTVLPYPLDSQQRRAIVSLEDNTLVISSAGSGKTSAIIGRARYLLERCGVDASRILIVTYTRKAAEELCERLGAGRQVECCTFHSLAYRIEASLTGRRPSICEPSLLFNVFRKLMSSDKVFLAAVLHYILHLQSLMKLEHEYDRSIDYFADRKKYGIQAPYTDREGNVVFTRSEEERRICIYLAELGVEYMYEAPYEIPTYTREHRQYRPDFTLYVSDGAGGVSRRVYLEHFAIDAAGKVPRWFGDKDPVGGWPAQNRIYNEGIRWKRRVHADNGTVLIETHSADFHSGNILQVLKHQLDAAGVPYRRVSDEELYTRLVRRSKKVESTVYSLLEQYVALLKSNCGSVLPMIEKARDEGDERTYVILSDIVKPLMAAYESELQRLGQMDFTDVINRATSHCAAGGWKTYDHILVDEFQDISADRYHFLQYLRAGEPKARLFCVGDDWQSIYRFAGSDMRLFYKFEEYFGYTERCKIEHTHRFGAPLLDMSSAFIQRNPMQVRKDVRAAVNVAGHTLVDFVNCGASRPNDMQMLAAVMRIVAKIPPAESVLLLGRYYHDVRALSDGGHVYGDAVGPTNRVQVSIGGRAAVFMTVRASKGTEADHVILINCESGIYGFPSLIEDDPILRYVLSSEDDYEYAEERRLFYVALTRARKHMYVLYHGDKPSPFVCELTDVNPPGRPLCPMCRQGHIVRLKDGVARNGVKYANYGCSNLVAGCGYFERVFVGHKSRFEIFNEQLRQTSGK
ncbi:MAG: UvrD-helicase domain-containing protein [Bacteroides sp.]|nr:UvrD-helicase domain-containing protein [Bacteroides sp.]MCM1094895.1 UvrD-helicase domain-containing protein [Terasakiella sp.]